MAYTQLTGVGPLLPAIPYQLSLAPAAAGGLLIDATGEKAAMVGRVWFAERTGTKNIRRVGFRFGAVTKAGGSALTVSLQDVDLTTGPPGQPDGTQDQTVAIPNADAAFVTNTWYRTGALSADRTVSFGDRLAVVVEYDGAGRLGADSVVIIGVNVPSSAHSGLTCFCVLFTASWGALGSQIPCVVLEFDDGTFGTLDGSTVTDGYTSVAINSGTASADEYAMAFKVDTPCKIDALWALVNPAASGEFELIFYTGNVATVTITVDINTVIATGTARVVLEPIAEQTLTPGTQYYVSVRPTTANNVTVYYVTVNAAGHLVILGGGPNFNYSTQLNQGGFAANTTTRRIWAGVRMSSLPDSASGGMIMSRVRTGM